MSKSLSDINVELDSAIPRSAVSQREGGSGRSLSYLAGHYVIDRLNKVFGPLGWASQTTKLDLVHAGTIEKYGKPVHSVHYIAQVRLVVKVGEVATEHTCTGYGDGSDKENIGKAHELAVKEAETDALKRCAKNLGMSMGLALYDKDQSNVVDDSAKSATGYVQVAGEVQPAVVSSSNYNGPAVASVSAARPKAIEPHADRTKAAVPHANREHVLKQIATTSKILVAQNKMTVPEMKAEMLKRYNTDVKENLTDEQAQEMLAALTKSAS